MNKILNIEQIIKLVDLFNKYNIMHDEKYFSGILSKQSLIEKNVLNLGLMLFTFFVPKNIRIDIKLSYDNLDGASTLITTSFVDTL